MKWHDAPVPKRLISKVWREIDAIDAVYGKGAAMEFLPRYRNMLLLDTAYGKGATFRLLEKLGAETLAALLFEERHGRKPSLADMLAEFIEVNEGLFYPIPSRWMVELDRLDQAFQDIHYENDGGAKDFVGKKGFALAEKEAVSVRQRQAGKAAAEQQRAKVAEMKVALVARARELKASDELRRNSYYQRLERFISDEFSETRTRRCIQGWLKEAGVEPPPI